MFLCVNKPTAYKSLQSIYADCYAASLLNSTTCSKRSFICSSRSKTSAIIMMFFFYCMKLCPLALKCYMRSRILALALSFLYKSRNPCIEVIARDWEPQFIETIEPPSQQSWLSTTKWLQAHSWSTIVTQRQQGAACKYKRIDALCHCQWHCYQQNTKRR